MNCPTSICHRPGQTRGRGAEATYELLMLPVGLVMPCPERVVATITKLVLPHTRPRRAADDLDGLNRVGGNLVGEDLALLVGDRLAVHGERVGGVSPRPWKRPLESAARLASRA